MLKTTASLSRPRLAAAQTCVAQNLTVQPVQSNNQCRSFRFGPWSSSAGMEARRRHHLLRYRYLEALSQRPLWGEESKKAKDTDNDNQSWSHRSSAVGTCLNVYMKSWPAVLRSCGKSKNSHDDGTNTADRSSNANPSFDRRARWDPFHSIRNFVPQSSSPPRPASGFYETHYTAKKTFIDPITNRKVTEPVAQDGSSAASPSHSAAESRSDVSASDIPATDKFSKASSTTRNFETVSRRTRDDKLKSDSYKGSKKQVQSMNQKSQNADDSVSFYSTHYGRSATGTVLKAKDAEASRSPKLQTHDDKASSSELSKLNNSVSELQADLDRYGPVYWNEPDGKPKPTAEELSRQYTDLDKYAKPWTVDEGILAEFERRQMAYRPKVEPLPTPVKVATGDPTKQYDDLHKYGPVFIEKLDRQFKIAGKEAYNRSQGDEQTVFMRSWAAKPTNSKYGLHQNQEDPASSYPVRTLHPNVYINNQAGSSRETSTPDATTSKGLPSKLSQSGPQSHTPENPSNQTTSSHQNTKSNVARPDEADEVASAAEIRANVLLRARESEQEGRLQRKKDAIRRDKEPQTIELTGFGKPKLTGNFVRDFPEELAASWSTANSINKSTLFPSKANSEPAASTSSTPQELDQEVDMCSMDESFPIEEAKLEPALERSGRRPARVSPSAVQHVQFDSSANDLGSQQSTNMGTEQPTTQPSKQRGAEESEAPKSSVDAVAKMKGKPVTYRILAYDPISDSIDIAEATSCASEAPTMSSPASVLPRLSSPYKFLPYFNTLRQQGYEIESGGGDVLVFRKVRDGTPNAATKLAQMYHSKEAPINPIDMMGKPVTGNFASPTGFVNYDLADRGECKTTPPFRANTAEEESREEPVRRHKPGRRVGRKILIGTAWTFGIAYAAGVLGEYFATGGADGLGPRGL